MLYRPCATALPGRLRKRPETVHADKAYDYRRCREALYRRGIRARIARRGIESSERLDRHQWVSGADPGPERTLTWLNRLRIRYERRADVLEALLLLGCSLLCLNRLRRF